MSIDNINDKDLLLNEVAADDENVTTLDEEQNIGEANLDGGYPPYKKTTTTINCSLQVKLDPENIAVYVCKGSKQCFSFTSLKCCGKGDITITAEDCGPWVKWDYKRMLNIYKFGKFELNKGGICFTPDPNLGEGYDPIKDVTLPFTARQCNGTDIDFSVTFVYDPCKCCCGCRS